MNGLRICGLCQRAPQLRAQYVIRLNCNVAKSSDDEPNLLRTRTNNIKRPILERMVLAMPTKCQPYMRLMRVERPIGTWLTLLPSLWSITVATPSGEFPDPSLMALFGVGAFLMRGFGCTVNDMWDRDVDKCVERTKNRPLAAGDLSRLDALWFSAGQAGLACLTLLQLNWESVKVGCASVGLVVLYPLMKRFTHWPQAFLAMVFNWGVLLGFSAVQGSAINWPAAVSLYAAAFSWTMIYDTIYAHQDRKHDLEVGMKSTALRFGSKTPLWLGAFATSMSTSLILAGFTSGQLWPYYTSVAVAMAHVFRQLYTLNIDDPTDCARKFLSNKNVGFIIWAGCTVSTLMKSA